MPLFRKHNAVFVHVPKTGGTTIDRILSADTNDVEFRGEGDGNIEFSHMTAKQLRAAIPDFAQLFSFGFVRNPWDRILSEYLYRVENDSFHYVECCAKATFEHYLMQISQLDIAHMPHARINHVYNQYDFLMEDGQQAVNFIGRFENFEEDLRAVLNKIGLDPSIEIPKLNATKHRHYRNYYSDETRLLVERMYAKDIQTFGYSY